MKEQSQSKQKKGTVYLIMFSANKGKTIQFLKCETWLDYSEKISKLEDVAQIENSLGQQFKGYDSFNITSFLPLRETPINGEQKIYFRKV